MNRKIKEISGNYKDLSYTKSIGIYFTLSKLEYRKLIRIIENIKNYKEVL